MGKNGSENAQRMEHFLQVISNRMSWHENGVLQIRQILKVILINIVINVNAYVK